MGYLTKTTQYILFVLMVCSLLVLPAVAGETLPGGDVSPTDSILNTSMTPGATLTEEPTAEPTEEMSTGLIEPLAGDPVVLFDGPVALAAGTFECTAYDSGTS